MYQDDVRQKLIHRIRVAFAGVSRENGRSLQELDARDNYATEKECLELRKTAKDNTWEGALHSYLGKECPDWEIVFLDSKGFHYYLPALMIWALDPSSDSKFGNLFSSVMFLMCNTDINKFEYLNEEQRGTVCQFLRFMLANSKQYGLEFEEKSIRRALKRYWAQFCRRNLESN